MLAEELVKLDSLQIGAFLKHILATQTYNAANKHDIKFCQERDIVPLASNREETLCGGMGKGPIAHITTYGVAKMRQMQMFNLILNYDTADQIFSDSDDRTSMTICPPIQITPHSSCPTP